MLTRTVLAVLVSTSTLAIATSAAAGTIADPAAPAPAPSIAAGQATSQTTDPASADQAAPASADTAKMDDIVVTGTSLRNVAPAGAEAFSLGAAKIQATGATSTDQLLATIPQLSSFGNLQTGNAGGVQLTVNRTNIRNLPQGVGGGSPTLVLMDGHRLVGEGVKQSYPDPDVIPPALIERVDVLTDGGSAIYGSDAVGGVINFITRRDFNGVQASIRQGFASSYTSTDINVTAGKAWSTGSVYVGYNYATHDGIYGFDRDYVRGIDYTTGLPTGKNCSPANVVAGNSTYAVVGGNSLVLSNANLCDTARSKQFYPKEVRHAVLAGFHQELGSSVDFEIKGYYSHRYDRSDGGPLQGTGTVYGLAVPANPGFPAFGVPATPAIPVTPGYISTGGGSTATQTVYFDFAPVGGREIFKTKLWAYGITPSVTWRIGHDWQMKAFYNYGQSQTTVNDPQVNGTALAAAISAGTVNPYNIAASNPAAISNVLNYTNYGIGKDTLSNAKVTFDGPLFRLPGGEVRVAVGGEYISEKFKGTTTLDTYQNVAVSPLSPASRNVKSGFAEINIPVLSADNHVPLVNSLSVSAAVRYDSYSDFGHNWAPSYGVSLKPVEWINLRARYNRSFQAPSLVQLSQASVPQASVFPGIFTQFVPLLLNPAVPFNGGPIVAVQGTVSPLQPQKARDYNLGVDISPPFIPGLSAHFTYFNIVYSGQIGSPPLGFGQFYNISSFSNLFIMTPSIAQIQTVLANAGVPAAQILNTIASVNAQGGNAYVVADIRARNLGISKVHGFDIGLDYHHDVSFGSIYGSFNSSRTNKAITAPDGVTFGGNLAGVDGSAFNAATILGATVDGGFRGQVTWNHLAGFKLSVPAGLNQMRVGAYDTFDLYLQYDLTHGGLPVSFSLGITNLLDKDPPLYRGVSPAFGAGYANGSTVGRLFQVGASLKF